MQNQSAPSLSMQAVIGRRHDNSCSRQVAVSAVVSRAVKRLADCLIAAILLIVTAPLLAILAAAIRLSMGPPALFRQTRLGYRGRPFTLFKLRTMLEARGPEGRLLPDEQRVTSLGRFLRRTSLDELPQLWNVLKGDMSLVGPRPLFQEYASWYTPQEARRHDVRPGMTGWAQVNGRTKLSWKQKMALDLWYVDHWSLWLDIRILAKTLLVVFRGE